jgi:preprotein translocase subunit SecF
VSPLTHWGKNLIKKTLTVVGLALVGMLVGVPAALAADYCQLCLAAGSTDVAVASGPLASTGVGLPIGLWVVAGLVIIAAGLGMVAVSARRRDRPSPSITA